MPFVVVKDASRCPVGRPWAVKKQGTDRTFGCHTTEDSAKKQQAALYSNTGSEAKSEAPPPPNLRKSTSDTERCGTCKMYDDGECWGYGNYKVTSTQVCDSFAPDTEPEANSAGTEVHRMTTNTVPMPHTVEWRVERARALSESQRKRPETRQLHEPLELREADADGIRTLRSYASLFNVPYTVRTAGYRFEETVKPGAFKRTLGTSPDVVFRYDHSGPPLARTTSGTLRLGEDDRGLWYEAALNPEDPDVKALIPKIERGDLSESSFAFRVGSKGDKWNEEHDKREVTACELDRGDVSVVTFGASRDTGKHMSIRSEEAMIALQEIGFERFMKAWLEWRDWSLLPDEERIGAMLSAQTTETLRQVLGLIADADDAVDEAEAMLADFLGIPNPDAEAGEEGEGGGSVTDAEQLGHTGRSEKRDDPDHEDYGIMYGLKDVKMAVASVIACQLCDAGNGTDPDDVAVMSALNNLNDAVDAAIVAQAKDKSYDSDEANAAAEDYWATISRLAGEVGWEVSHKDGQLQMVHQDEDRAALSSKKRNSLPSAAFVFPKDRRYPIHDISHARNALARASGKPEEAAVKRAVYKRYPSLKASNRAEVVLAPNDSQDLLDLLRLRSAS